MGVLIARLLGSLTVAAALRVEAPDQAADDVPATTRLDVEVPPAEPRPPEDPFPRRAWGLGATLVGVGASTTTRLFSDPGVFPNFLAVNTPTLELRAFLRRGDARETSSIDVSIPVINSLIFSVTGRGFGIGADVYYSYEFGRGVTRLIIGPGLGFAVSVADDRALGAARVVGQAGLSLVPRGAKFSFQLLGRPYFAVVPGTYTGEAAAEHAPYSGGVLFVLGLVVYRLRSEQARARELKRARARPGAAR
ncbi:MAG: hypothetical protein KC468_32750 [Myxococcales bacterium]|nr:hypothetical protein [Myxococcales bacterium]